MCAAESDHKLSENKLQICLPVSVWFAKSHPSSLGKWVELLCYVQDACTVTVFFCEICAIWANSKFNERNTAAPLIQCASFAGSGRVNAEEIAMNGADSLWSGNILDVLWNAARYSSHGLRAERRYTSFRAVRKISTSCCVSWLFVSAHYGTHCL